MIMLDHVIECCLAGLSSSADDFIRDNRISKNFNKQRLLLWKAIDYQLRRLTPRLKKIATYSSLLERTSLESRHLAHVATK